MSKKYTVYMHIFPDGKKYVGKTCKPLKWRWNGGLGYKNQALVFDAILKYDWNNIKHYVLFEDLDADTAALAEAYLIQKWRTFKINNRGKGYNSVVPNVVFPDGWEPPEMKKRRIHDIYKETTKARYNARISTETRPRGRGPKKVRLIETGVIYNSVKEAAKKTYTYDSNLCFAARSGYSSGIYYVCGERGDNGYFDPSTCSTKNFALSDVPENYQILWEGKAHWEYV